MGTMIPRKQHSNSTNSYNNSISEGMAERIENTSDEKRRSFKRNMRGTSLQESFIVTGLILETSGRILSVTL